MCSRERRARTTATDPGVGGLNRTRLATFPVTREVAATGPAERARSQPRGPFAQQAVPATHTDGACVSVTGISINSHTGQRTVKCPVNSGDLRINAGGIAMRTN